MKILFLFLLFSKLIVAEIYFAKILKDLNKRDCFILTESEIQRDNINFNEEDEKENDELRILKTDLFPKEDENERYSFSKPKSESEIIEIWSKNYTKYLDQIKNLHCFHNEKQIKRSKFQKRSASNSSKYSKNLVKMEVRNLFKTGEPKNRIDIVFLGDGYTLEEKDRFFEDMTRLTKDITLDFETFQSFVPLMNIWAIFVPSRSSGIGYNNEPKNTAFKLYRRNGELRGIYIKNSRFARKMCQLTGRSACDYPSLIANDEYYGGLGGEFAISSSSKTSGFIVLRHEFGHNFANVGEEYCNGQAYSGANSAKSLSSLKWNKWLDKTPPREEKSIYRLLRYPWHDLSIANYSQKFYSNGEYSSWIILVTITAAKEQDSVEFTLDGKILPWTSKGLDDRMSYEWRDTPGFSRGYHELKIVSKTPTKNTKIKRMIGSIFIYEFGNENEYEFDNNKISAYPTWSIDKVKSYRPTSNGCLMRNMTLDKLCPICKEAIWNNFLRKISLIDSIEIEEDNSNLIIEGTKIVKLNCPLIGQFRKGNNLIEGERLRTNWYYKGEIQTEFQDKFIIYAKSGNWKVKVMLETPEIRNKVNVHEKKFVV